MLVTPLETVRIPHSAVLPYPGRPTKGNSSRVTSVVDRPLSHSAALERSAEMTADDRGPTQEKCHHLRALFIRRGLGPYEVAGDLPEQQRDGAGAGSRRVCTELTLFQGAKFSSASAWSRQVVIDPKASFDRQAAVSFLL
jgi:hypothetical protein